MWGLGLQATSDGLQPNSNGLQPVRVANVRPCRCFSTSISALHQASEPADPSELQWWASGGIEAAEPGLWEHPENASFDRSLGLCIVCMLKIVEHFIATWSCAMQVEPLNDEFWQQD